LEATRARQKLVEGQPEGLDSNPVPSGFHAANTVEALSEAGAEEVLGGFTLVHARILAELAWN